MDNEQHLELAHWVIGFFDGDPMRRMIFNNFTEDSWENLKTQLYGYFDNLRSTSFVLPEPKNGKTSTMNLKFRGNVELSIIAVFWRIRVIYIFDGQVIVVK